MYYYQNLYYNHEYEYLLEFHLVLVIDLNNYYSEYYLIIIILSII